MFKLKIITDFFRIVNFYLWAPSIITVIEDVIYEVTHKRFGLLGYWLKSLFWAHSYIPVLMPINNAILSRFIKIDEYSESTNSFYLFLIPIFIFYWIVRRALRFALWNPKSELNLKMYKFVNALLKLSFQLLFFSIWMDDAWFYEEPYFFEKNMEQFKKPNIDEGLWNSIDEEGLKKNSDEN